MPTLDAKDSVEQPDIPGRTITHAHTPPAATHRNSQRQHQRIGAFGLTQRGGSIEQRSLLTSWGRGGHVASFVGELPAIRGGGGRECCGEPLPEGDAAPEAAFR